MKMAAAATAISCAVGASWPSSPEATGRCSAATATRLARRFKRGASLQPAPNPRKSGRGKLAPCHDFLIELVTQDPDITLAELRDGLEHAHGVRASISGVDQALRRLGYTFKKEPHCG